MNTLSRLIKMLCIAIAGTGSAVAADRVPLAQRALDAHWLPVGAEVLGAQRGGFVTPSGLVLSLGIERLVSVNGATVTQQRFDIPDLHNISEQQALQARAALSDVRIVQNGANNAVTGDAMRAAGATFIQNSLNDQTIRSHTTISTSVNSLSLLKDMNFQHSLRDSLQRAIGSP